MPQIPPHSYAKTRIFKRVQIARQGDVILLDYTPGTGTRVMVNGDPKGMLTGGEFYSALLRLWLRDQQR